MSAHSPNGRTRGAPLGREPEMGMRRSTRVAAKRDFLLIAARNYYAAVYGGNGEADDRELCRAALAFVAAEKGDD